MTQQDFSIVIKKIGMRHFVLANIGLRLKGVITYDAESAVPPRFTISVSDAFKLATDVSTHPLESLSHFIRGHPELFNEEDTAPRRSMCRAWHGISALRPDRSQTAGSSKGGTWWLRGLES
jgi:hypothetical protein